MKMLVAGVSTVICLAAYSTISPAASSEEPPKSALLIDGPLQKSRGLLAEIFKFKIEDGQLQLDRAAWEQSAKEIEKANVERAKAEANKPLPGNRPRTEFNEEMQDRRDAEEFIAKRKQDRAIAKMGPVPALHTLFIKLQQESCNLSHGYAGGGRFPAHSINGDWKQWQNAFRAYQSLSGDLRTNNDGEMLLLEELAPPFRTLEFNTDNKTAFSLRLLERNGDTLFIRQEAGGRFTIVEMIAARTFSAQAANYAALFNQRRARLLLEIIPMLDSLGIGPLPEPDSSVADAKAIAEQQKPQNDWTHWPLLDDAPWQKASDSLRKVFDFTLDSHRLAINWEVWDREAKAIEKNNPQINEAWPNQPVELAKDPKATAAFEMMKGMQSLFGGGPQPPIITLFSNLAVQFDNHGVGHGSGGTGEDATWDASFSAQNVSGNVDATVHTSNLVLIEERSPKRKLHFFTNSKFGFRIELTDDAGHLFSLQQGDGGHFSILALSDDDLFADQAESFADFCKRHRHLVDSELLPVLLPIGFAPILPSDNHHVRTAVMAAVLRSDSAQSDFEKLVANLESDEGKVRDKASQDLTNRYSLFADLIQKKLADNSTSGRALSLLRPIAAGQTNISPAEETAAALDLMHDPLYVISLLDGADAADVPTMTEYLEKISGQKLGPNREAWKHWAKDEAAQTKP